jgi:uncharacterized protein YfaS (alpha-2-macroglobulin family)
MPVRSERCTTRWTSKVGRAALAALLLSAVSPPADAARPLLDKGQWDAYFALFARDVSVPWKPATVRLDTYSGAPVEFTAYNVDPADVIIAGQNRQPRPLETAKRTPLARWKFSPPAGFRFESSDVTVPIGSQEGFYVIEARRGEAVQQVWINRTHIGLLTKESPEGLLLWAVDLRSGRPIANMNVSFLVGLQLLDRKTDSSGLVIWRDLRNRPVFALAESGAGRAFISILPQAPIPGAIVGLRLESAVVRAGSQVHFAGFARRRVNGLLKLTGGDARVMLVGGGRTLASTTARLDAAGAFDGAFDVPASVESGDYAILASAAGGVGGTSVHVDAAADLVLALQSNCPCDPQKPVAIAVGATRSGASVADAPVAIRIVRAPHIVPPNASESAGRWGTTVVYDYALRTGADGRATVTLPVPADGLDSTYGIEATTRGASATTRLAVANARVALAVEPSATSIDPGQPVAVSVRGFDASSGAPSAGLAVRLRLSHGTTVQEQNLTLDANGRANAVFHNVSLGSNLILADADVDGRHALDASAVTIEPRALAGSTPSELGSVAIVFDKARYRIGERMAVRASAPGASGDALITLDGARTYATRLGVASNGEATATLELGDPQGDVRVSAAFVRDGAIALGTARVALDGPGHARATELVLDRPRYAPGETARVSIRDGAQSGGATYAIRIADGQESGSAFFDDAPGVLSSGGTTSQNPASESPRWHAYVTPANSKASDIFAAEEARKAPTEPPSIAAAAPRTMLWRVEHLAGDVLEIAVPRERGHYILSVLKIADDGCVGAASVAFDVQ